MCAFQEGRGYSRLWSKFRNSTSYSCELAFWRERKFTIGVVLFPSPVWWAKKKDQVDKWFFLGTSTFPRDLWRCRNFAERRGPVETLIGHIKVWRGPRPRNDLLSKCVRVVFERRRNNPRDILRDKGGARDLEKSIKENSLCTTITFWECYLGRV